MGSCWSDEENENRCQFCSRRPVNNLIIQDGVCECCLDRANREQIGDRRRPLYGEFNCKCGRKWVSRRSWIEMYQICKRCRKRVYPHSQRQLRPGDIDMRRDRGNLQDHPKELCEMCIGMGHYCG